MARPLRIELDRALSNVTSRSNAGEPIFITDTNCALFLDKEESASVARLKTLLALASMRMQLNSS